MDLVLAALLIGAIAVGVWIYEHSVTRPCTQCGRKVGKGRLECSWCGYDFRR